MDLWFNINSVISILTGGLFLYCRFFIPEVDRFMYNTAWDDNGFNSKVLTTTGVCLIVTLVTWVVFGVVYFCMRIF